MLHTIKMKGGVVELLATPALFGIAQRKGMTIEADSENASEVYSAYTKLIYLAALNAWEVRRYDNPSMGECQYKLMDFVEWASNDAEGFVNAINFVLSALTHKELKDYATGEAKDPENAKESHSETDDGESVKKKSTSGWIMRLLRRS